MKLEKIEALRGFAAMYVVLHHSVPRHPTLLGVDFDIFFRFGQEAVILFFLLSGFVINYSFQASRDKSFLAYFLKRFGRIYIPLTLVTVLGYSMVSVKAGEWVDPQWKQLALNALMLQDLGNTKPNTIVEPYLNNAPLWSLSYEWWFYMLFFPIITFIATEKKQNRLVFSAGILSAIIYFYHPSFIPRLLMYMAIWWSGVQLSNKYLTCDSVGFKELSYSFATLITLCIILSVQVYQFKVAGKLNGQNHPFLEFRHMACALLALFVAICWNKINWVGFKYSFQPWIFFAPMSYAIYISHYYLVTSATYLSFIDNGFLRWLGYILCLLAFSYTVEVIIYPRAQRHLLKIAGVAKRS